MPQNDDNMMWDEVFGGFTPLLSSCLLSFLSSSRAPLMFHYHNFRKHLSCLLRNRSHKGSIKGCQFPFQALISHVAFYCISPKLVRWFWSPLKRRPARLRLLNLEKLRTLYYLDWLGSCCFLVNYLSINVCKVCLEWKWNKVLGKPNRWR